MTILGGDSFELYLNPALRFEDRGGFTEIINNDGPESGGAFIAAGGNAFKSLNPQQSTIATGFNCQFSDAPSGVGSGQTFFLINVGVVGSTVPIAIIKNGIMGSIIAQVGSNSNSSVSSLWLQNSWNHIQIKCVTSWVAPVPPATVGTLNVTLTIYWNSGGGAPTPIVTTIGSIGTNFQKISSMGFFYPGPGALAASNWWWTDGTLLGDSTVKSGIPTGVGAFTNWTPHGAANNWQCVKSVPPDLGATFVSEFNGGFLDTYAFAAMPVPAGGSISGVQVNLFAKFEVGFTGAANLFQVINIIGSGITTSPSASILTGTYAYYSFVFDHNPATGNPWGLSDIGGGVTQFGQDATT